MQENKNDIAYIQVFSRVEIGIYKAPISLVFLIGLVGEYLFRINLF
jgi:hypothetical protein